MKKINTKVDRERIFRSLMKTVSIFKNARKKSPFCPIKKPRQSETEKRLLFSYERIEFSIFTYRNIFARIPPGIVFRFINFNCVIIIFFFGFWATGTKIFFSQIIYRVFLE